MERVKPYFDVSSVVPFHSGNSVGSILELVGGSAIGHVKFYSFSRQAYFLEKDIELRYEFAGTSLNVAIISDIHMGGPHSIPSFETVVDYFDSLGNILKVFVLGDIRNRPKLSGFDLYLDIREKSNIDAVNWHEVMGNHDWPPSAIYTKLGVDKYYSLIIDNICFILLGNGWLVDGEPPWLKDTLTRNQDKNIIILTHIGRQGTTYGTWGGCGLIRPVKVLEECLEGQDWDAWFCGHSHGYKGSVGTVNEFYCVR